MILLSSMVTFEDEAACRPRRDVVQFTALIVKPETRIGELTLLIETTRWLPVPIMNVVDLSSPIRFTAVAMVTFSL